MVKSLVLTSALSSCVAPWVKQEEPQVKTTPAILDITTIKWAQASCLPNKGIKLIRVNTRKEVVCANGAKFRMPEKEVKQEAQLE